MVLHSKGSPLYLNHIAMHQNCRQEIPLSFEFRTLGETHDTYP